MSDEKILKEISDMVIGNMRIWCNNFSSMKSYTLAGVSYREPLDSDTECEITHKRHQCRAFSDGTCCSMLVPEDTYPRVQKTAYLNHTYTLEVITETDKGLFCPSSKVKLVVSGDVSNLRRDLAMRQKMK